MEKTVENSIQDLNEKLIANILHDVKSPLYSIKIALQSRLDSELNKDIFETVLNTLNYIENFLVIYNFKQGRFVNKLAPCNVKELIDKNIENCKYIFIKKDIHFDFWIDNLDYTLNTIPVFLNSIISNIISNIAFHAQEHKIATIEMYKKSNFIVINFKNSYNSENSNFNMGLNFCKNLINPIKANLKFTKTKNEVTVELKVPIL